MSEWSLVAHPLKKFSFYADWKFSTVSQGARLWGLSRVTWFQSTFPCRIYPETSLKHYPLIHSQVTLLFSLLSVFRLRLWITLSHSCFLHVQPVAVTFVIWHSWYVLKNSNYETIQLVIFYTLFLGCFVSVGCKIYLSYTHLSHTCWIKNRLDQPVHSVGQCGNS